MAEPLRIFIGYDPRQPIAFHALVQSIITTATAPVAITPLKLAMMPKGFSRTGLTAFTYARFLGPLLSGFKGRAVFMDSDVVVLGDVHELFETPMGGRPVAVRNDFPPGLMFERSAVMLFDCERCTKLTAEYVQNLENPMLDMSWADSVADLPPAWHFLAGYEDPPKGYAVRLVHYTQGIPCHNETATSAFGKEWASFHRIMNHSVPWVDLMGNSKHSEVWPNGLTLPKFVGRDLKRQQRVAA